ncbi:hypothetical protein [Euzebya sp.]|uniref:hypothetical protein n=1 Tax=Euzebya sp. TaxID=1971409 RepID=UPI003510F639
MRHLLRSARSPARRSPVVPSWVPRAAHDIGLAAWFGGAYMGAVALNGASREVDDPTQRARVANAGWFRWAAIVPVAVGSHLVGGVALTRRSGTARGAQAGVALARGALLVGALAATAESGRSGRTVSGAGDVPVATAVQPIDDTPDDVARAQRILRVVQWIIPAATGAMIVLDSWQQAHGGTRVAPERWLDAVLPG